MTKLSPQQQTLIEALKKLPLKLKPDGVFEYGDELTETIQPGNIYDTPDGKYKLQGIAPSEGKAAGITIYDKKSKVQVSRRLQAQKALQAIESADLTTLINIDKLGARDETVAATHLIPLFQEVTGKGISAEKRVNYIETNLRKAHGLSDAQNKTVRRNINAVIRSDKSIDAKVAESLRQYPDLYMFKIMLMAREAIASDKKDLAIKSIRNFSEKLKALLNQGHKTAPVMQAVTEAEVSVDEVAAGLQAAAEAPEESENASETFKARLIPESRYKEMLVKLREKRSEEEDETALKHPLDIAKENIEHVRAALNDTSTEEKTLLKDLRVAYDTARGTSTTGAVRRYMTELGKIDNTSFRNMDDDRKAEFTKNAQSILMYSLNHSQSEIKKQDKKPKPDEAKAEGFAKEFLVISNKLHLVTKT